MSDQAPETPDLTEAPAASMEPQAAADTDLVPAADFEDDTVPTDPEPAAEPAPPAVDESPAAAAPAARPLPDEDSLSGCSDY